MVKIAHALGTIILVFASLTSSATDLWKRDYSKADSVAATVTDVTDLKTLSLRLTQNLPDSIDKYRAIFSWVAHNIAYDCDQYHKTTARNVAPEFVLTTRATICSGYSNLFKALCDHSGLPCRMISGWAKVSPVDISEKLPDESDHAWNSIKLNKQWHLCDVTWGAGYADNNCSAFTQAFDDFYFCTPPELFNLQHYPENANWWQGRKMSKQKFATLPVFYTSALETGVSNHSPVSGIIPYKKGATLNFSFHVTEEIRRVVIESPLGEIKDVAFNQSGKTLTFKYTLKKYSPVLRIHLNNASIDYRMTK